ncbi:MAG: nitrile hydratase subunit beta [Pseudomonadota bacterium]
MNGPQDMGGLQGFGPVEPEPNEPVFHADWEKKALALTVAMGFTGTWNIDRSRFARESVGPSNYISWSYYKIWLGALEQLLKDYELASEEEIASGKATGDAEPVKRVLAAGDTASVLAKGGPYIRARAQAPAYEAGDRVRMANIHPAGHTRLPRYLRGREGVIHKVRDAHVFPDSNAKDGGEDPHWLYSVRFKASELWGDETNPRDHVHVDCWEPYLERL